MTLLQNMTDKRNGAGRKSHWPVYIIERIDARLAQGLGATAIARELDVPRSVVQGRKTRLKKEAK